MRRGRGTAVAVVLATVALGTFVSAGSARPERSTVDTFIFGEVTGRLPGKSSSRVAVRWDFKCLGDRLGEATYEWTLVAGRIGGGAARTVTLRKGTSKTGRLTTVLAPGRWQLRADPFLCETERGAGSTAPEVGQVVDVPDPCSWVVTRARGSVEADSGAVVRRARPGTTVPPATAVATPSRGAVDLRTAGTEAKLSLGPAGRLVLGRATCGGSPVATLTAGSLRAAARSPLEVRAGGAVSRGGASTWTVTIAAARTTIAVAKGRVTVRGKTGRPVVVRAGKRATVAGRGAPTVS